MFLNGAPDADYEADPARFFALFMAFATELDAAHAHVIAADAKVFNSHFVSMIVLFSRVLAKLLFLETRTLPAATCLVPVSETDASIAHARRDPDVW